jgi:phosphomevalonate kinase
MEGARQITAKANATIDKVNSTASSTLQILIVTDCRRPTDLDYFRAHQTLAHHHVIFIRVNASRTARESRGYRFAAGIDDAETECALDEFAGWSYDLNNDGDTEELARSFAEISNKLSNINALP